MQLYTFVVKIFTTQLQIKHFYVHVIYSLNLKYFKKNFCIYDLADAVHKIWNAKRIRIFFIRKIEKYELAMPI
jgi:hypothetical protein